MMLTMPIGNGGKKGDEKLKMERKKMRMRRRMIKVTVIYGIIIIILQISSTV